MYSGDPPLATMILRLPPAVGTASIVVTSLDALPATNSTVFPPGRTSGWAWMISGATSSVNGTGLPLFGGIRQRPEPIPETMMLSPSPHVTPRCGGD